MAGEIFCEDVDKVSRLFSSQILASRHDESIPASISVQCACYFSDERFQYPD